MFSTNILLDHPDIISRQATRYLNFINSREPSVKTSYTENHHILPRSIYPEFKNLRKIPLNSIKLTAREHFIAHCMLSRCFAKGSSAYHAMVKAFNMMSAKNTTHKRYMNSRLFEQNRSKLKTQCH